MAGPRREINVDGLAPPPGHSAHAVAAGDFCFLASAGPYDAQGNVVGEGDIAAQARQTCENIKTALEANDMGFGDIIDFKVSLLDCDDRPAINPMRQEFFGEPRSTSTLVGVNELPRPGVKLEVDAFAYKATSGAPAREELIPPGFATPLSHYTHIVKCGDYAWLAAVANDKDWNIIGGDDIAEQTRVTLTNMKRKLNAIDMDFEDISSVIVYLTNVDDRQKVSAVREEFFGAHRPASTLFEVKLAVPMLNVEIEAACYKPSGSAPKRKEIRLPQLNEPISHYTDAVQAGDFLHLAGAGPWTGDLELVGGDDIAAQCDQTLSNLGKILKAANMDFGDIVKANFYLLDINDQEKIDPVRQKYFGSAKPASHVLGIQKFALPGMRVEIDAIAYKPGSGG